MERDTRQRSAIRNAIDGAERPLSPPEILAIAQTAVPHMSLATVYRNLKVMQEDGSIAPVWLPGESARFEAKHLEHHHHFRCNRCERVFDIHGCAGNALHTVPRGFIVERHELTLYGLCQECASMQPNKKTTRASPTAAHAHAHGSANKPRQAKQEYGKPSVKRIASPRRTPKQK
jgi:Fur family transcriptional regulator, ferric uptake regulator